MNNLKKLFYRTLYNCRLKSAAYIGIKMGVRIGEECRILDDPIKVFGTEPYLISIGNHVEITHGVRLITHDGSMWVLRDLYSECRQIDKFGRITIGNNVFIGIDSIILPGVNIGNNVIIGAGSVVTKDIEDNVVFAGVPARLINRIDVYKNKVWNLGIDATKGLSSKEKENYLKKKYPEWF